MARFFFAKIYEGRKCHQGIRWHFLLAVGRSPNIELSPMVTIAMLNSDDFQDVAGRAPLPFNPLMNKEDEPTRIIEMSPVVTFTHPGRSPQH